MVITILVGVSGSGKTTFSKKLLDNNPNLVRVNRDDLRKTLFGADQTDKDYYSRKDFKECEKLVTEVSDQIIYDTLNKGKDVIIDNTNLQRKYIEEFVRKFNHLAFVKIVLMHDTSKEFFNLCKKRLEHRYREADNVAEKVEYLERQRREYIRLYESLKEEDLYRPQTDSYVKFDETLPKVYLFDIDGNLAQKGDRDIFDDSKLHLDTEIIPVGETLKALHAAGYKIIFMSGRQDSCRQATQKWLEDNNLWMEDSEMFMRQAKDQRCDSIVKEELLRRYVLPKYNVVGVFDDRLRVNRTWYKLGVFCFNTNQHLIQF